MTAAHVAKLSSIAACPCCGATRTDFLAHDGDTPYARLEFQCGAVFITANDRIQLSNGCLAASELAAKLWNIEVKGSRR
jgi:hypothetical protein